ncbi:hypothetical protein L484_010218 [Morus notabilis]|uniref:Uncharacterized protein n=1 Tax=Morus notabilis TaxID=981085 RepID=W9R4D4_9ROSA|nr:hypothetical protein L484_010218 [Morus notabilis]
MNLCRIWFDVLTRSEIGSEVSDLFGGRYCQRRSRRRLFALVRRSRRGFAIWSEVATAGGDLIFDVW